jgi:hypothetical protein
LRDGTDLWLAKIAISLRIMQISCPPILLGLRATLMVFLAEIPSGRAIEQKS